MAFVRIASPMSMPINVRVRPINSEYLKRPEIRRQKTTTRRQKHVWSVLSVLCFLFSALCPLVLFCAICSLLSVLSMNVFRPELLRSVMEAGANLRDNLHRQEVRGAGRTFRGDAVGNAVEE